MKLHSCFVICFSANLKTKWHAFLNILKGVKIWKHNYVGTLRLGMCIKVTAIQLYLPSDLEKKRIARKYFCNRNKIWHNEMLGRSSSRSSFWTGQECYVFPRRGLRSIKKHAENFAHLWTLLKFSPKVQNFPCAVTPSSMHMQLWSHTRTKAGRWDNLAMLTHSQS